MAIINFGDRTMQRNPWAEFERMRRDMADFSRFFSNEAQEYKRPTVYPALNVSEDAQDIYVRAEIPGVAPEHLDISIEGDTLTIKGERTPLSGKDKVAYHRRELEYGNFNRAITLPTRVKVDSVTAKNTNGILTIRLPKADEVKPRQIFVTLS